MREKFVPLQRFPFSSARKRMSVIIDYRNEERYLFVKGASEMVLQSCNKWFDPQTNKIEVISKSTKDKIEGVIRKMAEGSLRTLCLAYRPLFDSDNLEKKDQKGVYEIESNNLVMLCVLGVRDMPRKEVF